MQITLFFDKEAGEHDVQVVNCDAWIYRRLENGTMFVQCVNEKDDIVAWANVERLIHMEVNYDN